MPPATSGGWSGKLDRAFPGIGGRIMDDQGRIRSYVNVFVNSENSRDLQNERTRVKDGDTIHYFAVRGGRVGGADG